MATANPTTTGGSPMPVLTRLNSTARPGKRPRASTVPSGRPISRLRAVARPETWSDRSVTEKISPNVVSMARGPSGGRRSQRLPPDLNGRPDRLQAEFLFCLPRVGDEERLTEFLNPEGPNQRLSLG